MSLSKGKTRTLGRLADPRLRAREGLFLLEGVRAVRELTKAGLSLQTRFVVISPQLSGTVDGASLRRVLEGSGVQVEEVDDREFDGLSDTASPQGVLAVVEEPGFHLEGLLEKHARPRLLLLDGIQDPGNAGTLIRAALAFGMTGVVVLDGTVDPFNAKVVRSSAGAVVHLPVVRSAWAEAEAWLAEAEIPILAADAGGEAAGARAVEGPWALAVGNEGAGCRPAVLERAREILAVPMAPGVDSLNAAMAGAILLFALSGVSNLAGDP